MFDSLASVQQALLTAGLSDESTNVQTQKRWYRRLSQRAAVSLILTEHPELGVSVLMIQRAIHPGDPWSGQMGFPGGKVDPEDDHITATALRECQEELALDINVLSRIGRLSDILARP